MDHYDGSSNLYRFAAKATQVDGENILGNEQDKDKKNIEKVIRILNQLEIRPTRILVYEDEKSIHIDWYARNTQYITCIEEYLTLSLEFARYIDTIKNLDINVQPGMYDDDPDYIGEIAFTREKFDRNYNLYRDIDVQYWEA